MFDLVGMTPPHARWWRKVHEGVVVSVGMILLFPLTQEGQKPIFEQG